MKEILEVVFTVSVLSFVIGSMIAMGLSLTVRQILEPLRTKRLVLLSLAANFVLVPLFVYVMVAVIPLPEGVRTGLIILSLAAGAPFLPKLAALAKSDTAFAIGLMLLLMTVTIFYLPLVLPLLLSGAEVSPGAIARSLVVMMLIPLLAGLGVRARFRAAAERARPVFARISNIALLVMTATLLILHGGSLIDLFGFGVLAIILLLLAAVALGWFLGGPGRGTRVVLSLGTGQRNISAGIIVASQNFPDPDVTLTLIAAAILGLVIMLPAAGKLSRGKT